MANNYTTVSKKGIEYLCGLINQLANVSEGIDDLNLRTDGTFSSVKIDTLLNTLKTDCNEYTDRLVANLSRLELKIATSESEITQPNTMYLYKPSGSTSYEQYVVIEGTKVLLGTTDINMGDYYTITQADVKFVLKTDFDSLKTKVDGKVDKTDIVDNLTSTDTDKPLSANQGKVLKDEVDLKANDSDVVKKTDIITTTSNTATNEQVYGAFIMNTMLNNKDNIARVVGEEINVDTTTANIKGWCVNLKGTTPNGSTAGWFSNEYINNTTINQKFISYEKTMYIRSMFGGTWSKWAKVCTTSVADVPKTDITSRFSNVAVNPGGGAFYSIKNGICHLQIHSVTTSAASSAQKILVAGSLPAPDMDSTNGHYVVTSSDAINGLLVISVDGSATYYGSAMTIFTSFSYPVAES